MAVCTRLPGAALNPLLVPIVSTRRHHVDRLSFSLSISALPTSRSHCYVPPHAAAAAAAAPGGVSEAPPSTREEALSQARSSMSVFLEKALRDAGPSTVKQRKIHRQTRLRVELPLLDNTDATRASLLSDLLFSLPMAWKGNSVSFAVFSSQGVVEQLKKEEERHGENPRFQFYSIAENVVFNKALVMVILAPKLSDVSYVRDIAKAGNPWPILLLNPDWSVEEEAEASHASFLQSFDVIYSYLPLAIQGFFSKTEGAVLKHVKSGAPAGRPWLVFAKEGESLKCVISLKERPTPIDLENALYNAMAANSPVTKSIKFLRGLVGKT